MVTLLAAAPAAVRPADVVTSARRAGFSRPTRYRARQALGPAILDVGGSPHDPRKRWSLARRGGPRAAFPHGTHENSETLRH